jgi:hypothetical protein
VVGNGSDGSRLSSFLLGGLLGGLAGLAAGRIGSVRRPPGQAKPPGLAAFEQAPCYREVVEQEARERRPA